MSPLPDSLIRRIAQSLQAEEVDVYAMSLYCLKTEDLNYFDEKDRQRIKRIFQVLMDDTKYHVELLKLILEIGAR